MHNDVDERSAVGRPGRAFMIHWENRFRKDDWALLGMVVVIINLSPVAVAARKKSTRGVGGFNNVELPEEDLAWDTTGSSAWISRSVVSCF